MNLVGNIRAVRHLIDNASVVDFTDREIRIVEVKQEFLFSGHSALQYHRSGILWHNKNFYTVPVCFNRFGEILLRLKNGCRESSVRIGIIRKKSSVKYFRKVLVCFLHQFVRIHGFSDRIAALCDKIIGFIVGRCCQGSYIFRLCKFHNLIGFRRTSGMINGAFSELRCRNHFTATRGIQFFARIIRLTVRGNLSVFGIPDHLKTQGFDSKGIVRCVNNPIGYFHPRFSRICRQFHFKPDLFVLRLLRSQRL